MKIRNGFVSNSSSSSFIVILPKFPQSSLEVKEMLFGQEKEQGFTDGETFESFDSLSEKVFKDIIIARIDPSRTDYPCIVNRISLINIFSDSFYYYLDQREFRGIDEIVATINENHKDHNKYKRYLQAIKKLTIKIENMGNRYEKNKAKLIKRYLPHLSCQEIADFNLEKEYSLVKTNKKYRGNQKRTYKREDLLFRRLEKVKRQVAKIFTDDFLIAHKDKFIFITNYGDELSENFFLENGMAFKNVEHIALNY